MEVQKRIKLSAQVCIGEINVSLFKRQMLIGQKAKVTRGEKDIYIYIWHLFVKLNILKHIETYAVYRTVERKKKRYFRKRWSVLKIQGEKQGFALK